MNEERELISAQEMPIDDKAKASGTLLDLIAEGNPYIFLSFEITSETDEDGETAHVDVKTNHLAGNGISTLEDLRYFVELTLSGIPKDE